MDPFSIASAGMSVVQGVMGFIGGAEQARKQRAMTDEYVGRMKLEHDKKLGEATAIGAASGVEFSSSSLQKYLTDMAAQFRSQQDFARSQGYDVANSLQLSGIFSGLGDMGKGLFDFGKANNWWRSANPTAAPYEPSASRGMTGWRNS